MPKSPELELAQHFIDPDRVREAPSSVDYSRIRRLLEAVYRRCGRDDEMNFVPPEKVYAIDDLERERKGYTCYDSRKNDIAINLSNIRDIAEERGVTPETVFQHGVIHEEIHSTTVGLVKSKYGGRDTRQLGYDHFTPRDESDSYSRSYNLYRSWNEGVTEKLAREVTKGIPGRDSWYRC